MRPTQAWRSVNIFLPPVASAVPTARVPKMLVADKPKESPAARGPVADPCDPTILPWSSTCVPEMLVKPIEPLSGAMSEKLHSPVSTQVEEKPPAQPNAQNLRERQLPDASLLTASP